MKMNQNSKALVCCLAAVITLGMIGSAQATPVPPVVPDASSTLPLLGMGLGTLMLVARRFRK
jgi:hypothetical protein